MNNFDIDGVQIPFNNDWNSVAISVSGGADSALLVYLVCDLAKNHNITVHIINHVRMWKTRPWQQHDAERVYNWLLEKFKGITFNRHINFIAPDLEYGAVGPTLIDEYGKHVSGDNAQQRAYGEFICHKYNIDAYYNAVTHNPREVYLSGMHERDIERSDATLHLEYMIHMGRVVSHPFRFVDKGWVLKQYQQLDLMDLFETTRSCEGEFNGIDYTNYKPGQYVPTCGMCFWCKEREWAIGKIK